MEPEADEAGDRAARADLRQRRIAKAMALAAEQGGVIGRSQLLGLRVTRGQIRANIVARRWRAVGSQGVAIHTGELTTLGEQWAGILEAGPRAVLDGASALIASGLRGFDQEVLRISVPKSSRRRRARGLDIHQTRRYRATDLSASGVPRTLPHVAAVHGALWAKSDKQAVLLLTMAVQQGLTTVERLGEASLRIRRDSGGSSSR